MYNILFDEPFLGGEKIHKFNYQGHKLPATDFLNITNADRKEKTTALIGVPQVLEKPTSLRLAEPKTNPSAFVPWRQSHSSPDKTTDDQFQEIWSSLQAAKPQEGAMALKKLLKIKDESEATFEGPVKMFFEKMKASPLNKVPNAPVSSGFISTENCKPVEPNVSKFVPEKLECKQNNYFEQICAYHKQRNLPQPQISHESVCDKFVATLICHDGKIYSSLPRGSKDWATENVAKKAFTALTKFIPDNQEHYQNTKHENVLANQIKMTKSLMKAEVEAPSGSKEPRARREEPEFQSRRREYYENNLGPRSLPLPPEQWVAKSPKSEHFYHHQNSRRVERKNHRKVRGQDVWVDRRNDTFDL